MNILIRKKKMPNALFVILILIVLALIFQYGLNLRYNFSEPHPFNGLYLYNPYSKIDTSKWQIANFHAHTHKIPDIKNVTPKNTCYLDSIYSSLGYNIIGISDYQKINTFEDRHRWFVPAYEHGYMYFKNHHLVLNAKKVSWSDYLFRQTLNNKQFVINRLKKDSSALVTIVHPFLRHALTHKDLQYLSNYDCFEIADNLFQFVSYYETILSSGHHVFLIADDDSHDQKNPMEYAVCFNVINTVLIRDSILKALKSGRSFAVKFNPETYLTNESKKSAIHLLPKPLTFNVRNDTISIKLNRKVRSIKFIGQEGSEMNSVTDTDSATCFFTKEDTYLRAVVECYDGTMCYFNPVFRYDGMLKPDPSPPVNHKETWICRLIAIAIMILVFAILINRK
jgi:hypothetical protein